jgi:NitT/TauT family transport system permease protein
VKHKIVKQLIFYCFLISLWQGVVLLKVWPEYLFPAPLSVLTTLIAGLSDMSIPIAVGISLKRILIGYGIAIVLGGLLGVLLVRFKVLEETLGGLVLSIQTLPSVCWLPLALLWFGLNENAIIFIVVIGALFSITISIQSGIRTIPPLFLKAGINMGARRFNLFLHVILPAAMPSIVTGLKQGWSFAWRSLMAGELLFVSLGLGYLLVMGRELNDMGQVIAVMLIIAFISILMDKLVFGKIEESINRKRGLSR